MELTDKQKMALIEGLQGFVYSDDNENKETELSYLKLRKMGTHLLVTGWVSKGYEEDEFLAIMRGEDVWWLSSSGMEPEDVKFCRDLSWVPEIIIKAFAAGAKDAIGENVG